MSTNSLGPLIRLWGLPTEQLPPTTATPDDLAPLLTAILQEAVPFIDSAAPKSGASADPKLWKSKGSHAHPDSAARIEVLERVVPAVEIERVASAAAAAAGTVDSNGTGGKVRPETWCCRRSVHEDDAKTGTAAWSEFVHSFRDAHAESERAFTPDCVGAHQALTWDCTGVEVEEGGQTWTGFKLLVEEMRHRVGRPVLRDRTFPVLQMTCGTGSSGEGEEFVVVSIPVPDFGAKSQASRLASEKGALVAVYVSVERIRKMEDGKVEWLMATASDAGGALPAWVQNLAAPGVIWKDVPLFLGWIAKERRKGTGGSGSGGESKQTEDGGAVPLVEDGTNNAGPVETETPQASAGAGVPQTTKLSESA
ncbi:hypothetical protein F5Y04DRAFT_276357 [Hypomontagnella monticulosa]|nr:hypothetical protein F5Y04DRAFT_276357 [Hypomontagnella monticulosa]